MADSGAYFERQRFTQWWVWVMMGGMLVLAAYAFAQQILLGEPFGENPMPDPALVVFVLFVFGIAVLLWRIRLDVKIDASCIEIHFFPLFKRRIDKDSIASAEMIRYGFVGYGIRSFTRYGTVYNTGGREGLSLVLKNGRKLVIGTAQKQVMFQSLLNHGYQVKQ